MWLQSAAHKSYPFCRHAVYVYIYIYISMYICMLHMRVYIYIWCDTAHVAAPPPFTFEEGGTRAAPRRAQRAAAPGNKLVSVARRLDRWNPQDGFHQCWRVISKGPPSNELGGSLAKNQKQNGGQTGTCLSSLPVSIV